MKGGFCKMPVQNATYRHTTARLGLTMLLMLALFYVLNKVTDGIGAVLLQGHDDVTVAVAQKLLDSAAYLLAFMLPVPFLYCITPSQERGVMRLSPRLPRRLWLTLPAGLSIIYIASIVNAVLLGWLGAATPSSGMQWIQGVAFYEGVLLFLASALVPAFCEELLFRGAVLHALLPYGKTTAVLGSALLFSLMHQSADQLLYTAVAGVVLAYVVLESGSIWAAVLLHMMNNTFAVVQNILYEQLGKDATLWICVGEVVLIGGGLICLVFLVATAKQAPHIPYCLDERPSRPVKDFFTLPTMAYTALSVGQMILLLALTGRLGV